jgi:hypothetical protein
MASGSPVVESEEFGYLQISANEVQFSLSSEI